MDLRNLMEHDISIDLKIEKLEEKLNTTRLTEDGQQLSVTFLARYREDYSKLMALAPTRLTTIQAYKMLARAVNDHSHFRSVVSGFTTVASAMQKPGYKTFEALYTHLHAQALIYDKEFPPQR